jgi:hypothetical protein
MKNIFKTIGAISLLMAIFTTVHASNTCQRTDLFCHPTGPSQSQTTPFRVDASGNMTTAGSITTSGATSVTGISTQLSNISLGVTGTGVSNASTAANTALSVPVMVSTAIVQGMAIIATTLNGTSPTLVNGVMPAATGSTAVIGIADAAASSGSVVNVDYSGVVVALTTGAVTVGDLLVSTASLSTLTYGYLATNNSAAAGAIVGTALATQPASYSGLTRVLLKH